jgi:hypothetical protein
MLWVFLTSSSSRPLTPGKETFTVWTQRVASVLGVVSVIEDFLVRFTLQIGLVGIAPGQGIEIGELRPGRLVQRTDGVL